MIARIDAELAVCLLYPSAYDATLPIIRQTQGRLGTERRSGRRLAQPVAGSLRIARHPPRAAGVRRAVALRDAHHGGGDPVHLATAPDGGVLRAIHRVDVRSAWRRQ